MIMLNKLKSGKMARIVTFKNDQELKNKFISEEISKLRILGLISCFSLVTFKVNSKIFTEELNNLREGHKRHSHEHRNDLAGEYKWGIQDKYYFWYFL